MVRIGVALGYRIALGQESYHDRWENGMEGDISPYGYKWAESRDVQVDYISFGKMERRLFCNPVLGKVYFYGIKLPLMLLKCDCIWTHFDKDALYIALLKCIPLLGRLFAPQVSNFIWLIDASASYSPLKKRIMAKLLAKIDRILFLSATEEERFMTLYQCPKKQLRYVPFGINPDSYQVDKVCKPVSAVSSACMPMILSVGTDIHRDVGLLRQITREMAEYDFVFATANREYLKLSFSPNTLVLRTDLQEMRWLYKNCACVVIPLKYNEHASGCTTALEAAAMGKPVVISDVPGIRGYVENGVTGIIVPCGDGEAMKNAIARLVSDPAYADRMGRNAHEFMKERFTSQKWAQAHLALTREVLGAE